MDYRVMKRPMFKMGGPTSGGTGITSGLDTPKRGLVDEPGSYAGIEDFSNLGTSSEMEKILMNKMINRDQNYSSMMGMPKLNAIGSIATNVLPNIERGGLKGIVDILKDPNTINAAIQGLSQTKNLELQRDNQKLKDMAAIISMKQGREKLDKEDERYEETFEFGKEKFLFDKEKFEKTYDLKLEEIDIARTKVNKESDRELRARFGQEADALIAEYGSLEKMPPEILSQYERKQKIALGTGFKTKQEAKVEALKAVSRLTDLESIGMKKFNELVEQYASSIYYGTSVENNAEGGRVGRAMGGGFDMGQEQPMQATQTMAPEPEMMPQGGGQDMGEDPFTILRQRLPQEISDEVVSLIAYNKIAFQDFANIQDQDDVDLFNQKYNVQLVVDMASR